MDATTDHRKLPLDGGVPPGDPNCDIPPSDQLEAIRVGRPFENIRPGETPLHFETETYDAGVPPDGCTGTILLPHHRDAIARRAAEQSGAEPRAVALPDASDWPYPTE